MHVEEGPNSMATTYKVFDYETGFSCAWDICMDCIEQRRQHPRWWVWYVRAWEAPASAYDSMRLYLTCRSSVRPFPPLFTTLPGQIFILLFQSVSRCSLQAFSCIIYTGKLRKSPLLLTNSRIYYNNRQTLRKSKLIFSF